MHALIDHLLHNLFNRRITTTTINIKVFFLTNSTYIILKRQDYIKAHVEEAKYNKVPRSRSRAAAREEFAGELQRSAVVWTSLAKGRLVVVEDAVKGDQPPLL
jgi:hypothetical protein